uniref:ZAD domain-containing protein n=1 Tax=Stomoxys calcitrans TaxID=35570 RepID=A0A1I8P5J1_STOCA
MSDKNYPNMDTICRMCLKEDGGTVSIFPSSQAKDEKHSHISIPMRIMSCVALEVQAHDGMPPKICSTCRYQLEKCYLFRKQSQAADAKLRKHIRLLSVGKTSKVFLKNPHDDDDDDEAEFQDSLDFINEMEEKTKEEEKLRFEVYKEEMQVQKDAEISALRQALKDECKDEVRLEIEERVRAEVKKEMQKEFDEILLPKIKEDCLKECRDSMQEEVREECRQIEITTLLSDLHDFLEEKQTWRRQEKKQNNTQINKSKFAPSSKQEYNDEGPSTNEVRYSPIHFIEIDKSKVSSIPVHNQAKPVLTTKSAIKKELILDDNPPDTTTTNVINDDEDDGDSDKYLIYDTDEGFEFQKRSELSNDNTEEEEGYMPESSQHYDSGEENTMTNDIAPKATTTLARTTSYRIEDAENGDITFLKKSSDSHSPSLVNAGNSVGQLQNDSNIVILNFPNDLEGDDDHLELLEYNEDLENKVIKPVVESGPAPKRFRSSEQNVSSPNSQQFTTTTTTSSTIETTTV